MVYHYYMKINLKLLLVGLFIVSFLPCLHAQVTVVKQDGSKIYLDTSDFNRKVAIGDTFKIITSQEKLTNPKTGKDLGTVNHYSPEGKIIEVQPLYAIGQISGKAQYTVGQEAVIEFAAAPTAPGAAATTSAQPAPAAISNRNQKTYNVLEREIISAVQADLAALPGDEIAAVDTNGNLILYTAETNVLKELATYKLPSGYKPVTLSAKDLMGNEYAQLFVVGYKENERKISTFVLTVQENEFKQEAILPYFVKEIGCDESKKIYAQKPFISGKKPGNAHVLIYEKGRFKLAKDSFSTRHNWLTGINKYAIQNEETDNFIYTASNGHLRMRMANGKFIESPDLFARAPNRVKYKQEILSFYPSLEVYGPKGHATLAGIENTTKFGLLSEQFGQYNGGKMHFLTYGNGALTLQETLDLQGFAYDMNCTERGILVPQVISGEQTILTEIYR